MWARVCQTLLILLTIIPLIHSDVRFRGTLRLVTANIVATLRHYGIPNPLTHNTAGASARRLTVGAMIAAAPAARGREEAAA